MSTYRIKPLVWDEGGPRNDRWARSAMIAGTYSITRSPGRIWNCYWTSQSMSQIETITAKSYEAAKQAAQQDWERRLGQVLDVVEESAR